MELYLKVRLACSEGMSRRQAAKHFNISRDSVAKMLSYSTPPGYRRRLPIRRPKLDAFVATIDRWLDEDVTVPRKQRHTAKRVFDRLRDECEFTGGYTIIKDYMREREQRCQEVFVPLAHPPGHAQADFGEAMVVIGGVERKAYFFVLDLPHSDACYVRAYPAAVSEAWADGHIHAFSFFGGVPQSRESCNVGFGGMEEAMRDLFWLSDEAWAALDPHLPKNQPGKPRVDDRCVISGILHILKTGRRWRDVPPEYGPAKTIYNRYARWALIAPWTCHEHVAKWAAPDKPPEWVNGRRQAPGQSDRKSGCKKSLGTPEFRFPLEKRLSLRIARLVNIGLRGGTLGIRFLFIFFLARYLDPASVGYYGLFTATIAYGIYFVGLDFYIYTTREIIRTGEEQRGQLLKGQAALSAMLYVALLPVAILLLRHAGWPAHLIWWFAPLLLLEHFNQEVYRLLIALSQQISASLLLFMRQGSWGLAIVVLMAWNAESRHLDAVMSLWAFSGVATTALGIMKLRRLRMGGWRLPVDWAWIRKGIALSATFLVATLALRGVQTIDRYWLEALGGIEVVGAYVLFLGIAGTLLVFLDAGVFAYAYPELIRLAHDGKHALARKRAWQMLFQTLALSAAFALVSWFVLPFLLDWIGNPVYKDAIELYPWILMAMTINALGMVPHYVLYAYGKDRPIISSHLAALPVFVLSTWLVSLSWPMLAVPIGLGASFTLVLVWKTIACWWYDRNPDAMKPAAKSSYTSE